MTFNSKTPVPQNVDALHNVLRGRNLKIPKRLRQCADYILENHDRIAVSTVADLASGAGVQPSAVIRLCQFLGFSGYSELQRLYRSDYEPSRPDYATRLKQLGADAGSDTAMVLARFVEAGRVSVENVLQTVDLGVLQRAVGALAGAQTIHVVGVRRAFAVASHLAYSMEEMDLPVLLHQNIGTIGSRNMIRPGDVMIAVTFAPYAAAALEMAQFAHDRGVPVVAITDVAARGLTGIADMTLTVREFQVGEFRGLTAAMSLSMALAVSVGQTRHKKT